MGRSSSRHRRTRPPGAASPCALSLRSSAAATRQPEGSTWLGGTACGVDRPQVGVGGYPRSRTRSRIRRSRARTSQRPQRGTSDRRTGGPTCGPCQPAIQGSGKSCRSPSCRAWRARCQRPWPKAVSTPRSERHPGRRTADRSGPTPRSSRHPTRRPGTRRRVARPPWWPGGGVGIRP